MLQILFRKQMYKSSILYIAYIILIHDLYNYMCYCDISFSPKSTLLTTQIYFARTKQNYYFVAYY